MGTDSNSLVHACRIATFAVVFLASTLVHGSILVTWDLTGDPGSQVTEPAAFNAPGITGAPMSRGAGLGPNAGLNSFNSNNWDDEIDEYIQFGFTVSPGNSVDLENLIIATRSSPTGPGTIGLFTSLDGFASAIHTFNQTPGDNFVNTVVDLTPLPALSPGPFLVRLIEIGDTQADGVGATLANGTFRVAEFASGGSSLDVQFNGTIAAVPEVSTFAVWAFLALSVGACWKRIQLLN
jgi:hypothetical protein